MLDRILLETFYYITKYNSFSQAAVKMFVSQGTVSTRIKNLEQNLGKELLIRNKGGVILTSHGKILLNYIENLRYNEKMFLDEFLKENPRDSINLGITPVASQWFSDYVVGNVNYQMNIEVHFSNVIIENVVKRKYDLGIIRSEHPYIIHKDLSSIPITKDHVTLVAHKDHPIFKAAQLDLERVAQYPIIGLGSDVTYLGAIYQLFEHTTLFPKKVQHFSDLNSIQLFLLDKNSIAILSSYVVEKGMNTDSYKILDIKDIKEKSRYALLIYNKQQDLAENTKSLISFLKEINNL